MEKIAESVSVKACPHCGKQFGFVDFLLHCGSDTLISHRELEKRVREHRCGACGRVFEVRYDKNRIQKISAEVLPFFLGSALMSTLAVKWLMNLTNEQTAAAAMFLFLAGYLVHLIYLKYQMSDLKPC